MVIVRFFYDMYRYMNRYKELPVFDVLERKNQRLIFYIYRQTDRNVITVTLSRWGQLLFKQKLKRQMTAMLLSTSLLVREAAKKVLFLVARPLKKKNFFLRLPLLDKPAKQFLGRGGKVVFVSHLYTRLTKQQGYISYISIIHFHKV